MRGRLVGLAVLGPIRSADGTSNDSGFENLPIFFLIFLVVAGKCKEHAKKRDEGGE